MGQKTILDKLGIAEAAEGEAVLGGIKEKGNLIEFETTVVSNFLGRGDPAPGEASFLSLTGQERAR